MQLFKHKAYGGGKYFSPYLLEVAHSGTFSSQVALGTLTANAPGLQTVSCARALAAYCMGNDGLLHLLGTNTVRVEPLGLLVEGASTNELLQSNTYSNVGWTKTGTTVAQNVTGPDGVVNGAWTVTCSAGSSAHVLFSTSTGATGIHTYSIFAKAGTVNFLGLDWANTHAIVFDLRDGTTSFSNGVTSSKATAYANGWWKVEITFTVGAGETAAALAVGDTAANANAFGGGPTWTAAGTETVLLWNVQSETTPFSTSPIPTTTVAVTRPADVVTVANPLNPSNPGTWSIGVAALPMSTWANIYSASGNSPQFLALGNNAAANTTRLGSGGQALPTGQFDVNDNLNAVKTLTLPSLLTGSALAVCSGKSAAGTLTATPGGGSGSGPGTGSITTQPATITIGQAGGLTGFGHWGWLTNVFVSAP